MNIDVKISVKPIEYIKSVNMLEKRVADFLQGKKGELLWILEHNPVYTVLCSNTHKSSSFLPEKTSVTLFSRNFIDSI